MKRFSRLIPIFLSLVLMLTGCARFPQGGRKPELPGRTGPVYVQWMEEQSCLRKATDITSVVSGSSLGWQRGSGRTQLPQEARIWFHASVPLTTWTGQTSFLAALARDSSASKLASLGVQGIFLSGLSDTGDEWAGRSPASGLGEDETSLGFGRLSGTEEDYQAFLATFSHAGLLTGGMLLPAHTGMGPDFFLASRAVRDYPGLYAMTELSPDNASRLVPETLRNATPESGQESIPTAHQPPAQISSIFPLAPRQIEVLTGAGLLPESLVQDNLPLTDVPRGWAMTGPVAGVDGVQRRWLYRWYARPDRPVLHWDDPSGTARRILEASLIQQTGLRHQILAGVSIGAWMGLDASSDTPDREQAATPGRQALSDLARNAHRYGAALLVKDAFALPDLAGLQRSGADFFFDSALSPSLELALLMQSAAPLRSSLRLALKLNIDQRKLWRGTPDGTSFPGADALLPFIPSAWKNRLISRRGGVDELRLNAPTLAAVICGLEPGARPDGIMSRSIRDIHLLQIATRSFLPGLLMLSGSDLDGGLPDGLTWRATPPLWQMHAMPSSRQGLPSGYALYRHLPASESMEEPLSRMLQTRISTDIASATLVAVPSCGADTVLAAVSVLPGGGHLAFFGNFSAEDVVIRPDFSQWNRAISITDALSGRTLSDRTLTLPSWGWQVMLLR